MLHPFPALDDLELRVLRAGARKPRIITLISGFVVAIGLTVAYFAPSPEYGDARPTSDRIGLTVTLGLACLFFVARARWREERDRREAKRAESDDQEGSSDWWPSQSETRRPKAS